MIEQITAYEKLTPPT